MHVNMGRMNERLDDEQLEAVYSRGNNCGIRSQSEIVSFSVV